MPAYHLSATLLPDGDAPRDMWVVDGKMSFVPQDGGEELAPAGGYVLPGLVDCHFHLTLDLVGIGLPDGSAELIGAGLEGHLASGTLLVRDMGIVGDVVPANAVAGLPRVQSAGHFLAPDDGYFGIQEKTAPEELAGRAQLQAEAGHPWVKIIADWPRRPGYMKDGEPNYSLEVMAAAVEAAQGAGAKVAAHAVSRAGCERAVMAGVDSLEHGVNVDETLLKIMAERGIAWTPTAIIGPQMVTMAEGLGGNEAARGVRESFENQRVMLPLAAKLGVTILAGTDICLLYTI
jgi:imidazolonepropionase-like amidohydrolase